MMAVNLVAGGVPVSIVDLFEVIDIKHYQGKRMTKSSGAVNFNFTNLKKAPRIIDYV